MFFRIPPDHLHVHLNERIVRLGVQLISESDSFILQGLPFVKNLHQIFCFFCITYHLLVLLIVYMVFINRRAGNYNYLLQGYLPDDNFISLK